MRDERVATAERSEVIALLTRALDDGRLDIARYDARVAAVGAATYASELVAQLGDLGPEYAWLPPTAVVPATARTGPARAALVFGILSLPTSFCVFGGLLGIVAIVLSFRGHRPRGLGPALLGRVFGVVGLVLSLGALFGLIYALNNGVGP
ncbi:MAG TPA: DUF1707 domain-containing protein [Actinoplanes sp.]|nr:DUF1707 domain-containing protein [Actinoplanes sp.]